MVPVFHFETYLILIFCRGERAFCSLSCRSLEILIDEELEKSNDKDPESPLYSNDDDNDDKELFEAGLKAAT